jgi:outer membrane receptor protein involved in Fe transport
MNATIRRDTNMSSRTKITLGAGLALVPLLAWPQQPQQAPADQVIEEIVVTGTYIRRQSQFDSPSPLTTIGYEDIEDLGVNEISDIIERMPINTGSQNSPDAFTQNFSTGTTNINLRGLGVSSTLVMLNSRRQVQSAIATNRGENFVDTSALPPMIAFDRIETLKDGATALYGSDAVAGVVNFITRSNFEGFDLQLDLQAVDAYPQQDTQLSGVYGVGSDRTHLLAAFSFLDRDPLSTADRRLSGPTDDLSRAGNPGTFIVPTLPGNPAFAPVWTAAFDSNFNGVADAVEPLAGLPPVPGAVTPVFADQNCANVAAQDPKVVTSGIVQSVPSPAGDIGIGLCQFDFGSFWHLVPEEDRRSAYLELTHDFNDRTGGRLEFHWVDNEARRNNSPSFPIPERIDVGAAHPDNPYGVDVLWVGRLVGAGGTAVESIHDSETWRIAGSLTGEFNDTWGWDAGLQLSENEFFVATEDILIDRFDLALRGLGGAGCDPATGTPGSGSCVYYNPFGTALTGPGTRNSPALLDHLLAFLSYTAKSELMTLEGVVVGEIGELAGGPAGIAIGAQFRDEELTYDYNEQANRDNFQFLVGNPDFADSRDVAAAFIELALPLSTSLDLQLAARIEDYGSGVDSADPKASFLWRPNLSFSLRGSVGTSFRAPSLFQAFGTQTALEELTDPLAPDPQFFPVRTQPNPSGDPLQPEEADVLNFGFSWSVTDNVEFGIDYWSFDYTNVIIQQNAQALLDAAAAGNAVAAAQIERDALGGLVRVNSFYDNASSLETDGFDLSIAYDTETSAGSFRVGAEATMVSTYDLVDPQAGTIDGAGKRNFANFATSVPELRGNLFFNWRRGNHGINVYVNHIDSYVDDEGGPAAFTDIDSHTTVDANYNVFLESDVGITLSFGGINLSDEDPPRVSTNLGFDSKVHDPRGRMFYVKAGFAF